jgi:hypothetical protein
MIKLADAANLRFSFILSHIFSSRVRVLTKLKPQLSNGLSVGQFLGPLAPRLFLFWSATSNSIIMIKQFVTERQAYLADSETLRRAAARGRESSWRRHWAWSCMLTVASQEDADYFLIAV